MDNVRQALRFLLEAFVKALLWALLAGATYWTVTQWVDAYAPAYAPSTIVTDDYYVILP